MSFTKKIMLCFGALIASNQSCLLNAMAKNILMHKNNNSTPSLPGSSAGPLGSSGIGGGVISPVDALLVTAKEANNAATTSTSTTTTEPTTTTSTTTTPEEPTTTPEEPTTDVATTAPVVYTTSTMTTSPQPSAGTSNQQMSTAPSQPAATNANPTSSPAPAANKPATDQHAAAQAHPATQPATQQAAPNNHPAAAHPAEEKHEDKKPEPAAAKKEEKSHAEEKHEPAQNQPTAEHKNKAAAIIDQEEILKTLEIINTKDARRHHGFNEDSLNLLFNNFVYFKEFITTNFEKEKLEMLAIEFINQLYPTAKTLHAQLKNHEPEDNSKNITGTIEDDLIVKSVQEDEKNEKPTLFEPHNSMMNNAAQERSSLDALTF